MNCILLFQGLLQKACNEEVVMGKNSKIPNSRENKDFYKSFFDKREYEREDVERYKTIFRLIDESNISHEKRVLDIGCGGGAISKTLDKLFDVVYAYDISLSPDMRIVLQEASRIHFVEGILPYLPIADSCIDLVVFSEVLEHLYKEYQAMSIEAIARVVRKGCFVILTTPNPLGIRSIIYVPIKILKQILGRPMSGQLIENWIKPIDLQRMVEPFFFIEKRVGTNYVPPYVDRLPYSISSYLYRISSSIGRKQILSGLGEYQYYLLRRL